MLGYPTHSHLPDIAARGGKRPVRDRDDPPENPRAVRCAGGSQWGMPIPVCYLPELKDW